MTAEVKPVPYRPPAEDERDGLPQWLLSTDHKRIGLLTIGTALFLFFFNGAIALTMRAQLAQPGQDILSPQSYLQFMTIHGTGMITLTITPLAVGLGMYLGPDEAGGAGESRRARQFRVDLPAAAEPAELLVRPPDALLPVLAPADGHLADLARGLAGVGGGVPPPGQGAVRLDRDHHLGQRREQLTRLPS